MTSREDRIAGVDRVVCLQTCLNTALGLCVKAGGRRAAWTDGQTAELR